MFGKRSDFNVDVFATLYRINVCKWKFFAELKWKQYIPIDNIALIWFLEQIQNYQKNQCKDSWNRSDSWERKLWRHHRTKPFAMLVLKMAALFKPSTREPREIQFEFYANNDLFKIHSQL